MLLLATFAMLAASELPAAEAAAPDRKAHAAVRIVTAARISLGEAPGEETEATIRKTQVREADGSLKQAVLVEFS